MEIYAYLTHCSQINVIQEEDILPNYNLEYTHLNFPFPPLLLSYGTPSPHYN